MKNNYIIIHGSFATPFINWFKWLNDELIKQNKAVIVPQFPIGLNYQNYTNWSKLLDYYKELGYINETTTLIGHSLSPVFIIKYLIKNKIKIKKIISISGFNNYFAGNEEYDTVNKSFYLDNLEDIKRYCTDITCLYSDNDPYISQEELKQFANKIATNKKVIPNGGHLNDEAGYNKFEELLEEL